MSQIKKCIKLLVDKDNFSILRNDVNILDNIPADKLDDVLADLEKAAKDAGKTLDDYLDDMARHGRQSYKALKMWKLFTYEDLLKVPPIKKPCFLAGTLVKTESGLKPIEQIQKGELVYAYNFEKQQAELKPVTELFTNVCDQYINIFTPKGKIQATGAHRFWIPAKNKWVKARELTTDMCFLNAQGEYIKIEKLNMIDQVEKTYNFEVADLHNYFVGLDEILSHNKSIKDSIFASTEILEINFYKIDDVIQQPMYVGQTTQDYAIRFGQHRRDPKKADWVKKMEGVFRLQVNGKSGPFSMTPYEAAVTELYEINYYKGTTKSLEPFKNKQKPIGKRKFKYFKKYNTFNPCQFYI